MTPAQASPITGRNILIVEDEALIAMELEEFLEKQGAIVVGVVASVARGHELLNEVQPDAALLDLNLGGEDSTPLAEALVERNIPFVVLTGYGRKWMEQIGFAAGPFIEKPVNFATLLRRLKEILS